MKRHFLVTAMVASLGLGAAMAGCTTTTAGVAQPAGGQTVAGTRTATPGPGTSTAPGGTAAAVQFSDEVCGAALNFFEPAFRLATFGPDVSSPAAAVRSVRGILGELSGGLGTARTELGAVDASKVADGDKVIAAFTDAFTQLKQKIDASIGRLDAVNPNDPRAVSSVLRDVAGDLRGLSQVANTFNSLGRIAPELDAAVRKAPTCTRIARMAASVNSPSTSQAPPR